MVECLPSKHEALSSNPRTEKKRKEREREKGKRERERERERERGEKEKERNQVEDVAQWPNTYLPCARP
jgi:hypothetical protein